MSIDEFCQWIAFYNIEPWGSVVDGYRNASISSVIANAALAATATKGSRRKTYKLEDFLIGITSNSEELSDEDKRIKNIHETLMALSNRKAKHDS